MDGKEAAGRRAAELVQDGMVLGLGTGSTVAFFLDALKQRIEAEGLAVSGVATSERTSERCRELGIPTVGLDEAPVLDLAVDGADEVDGRLDLVKGGGGALLREKVVADASARLVIIVSEGKQVEALGVTFPLPVEVVPFAATPVARCIAAFGADPVRRTGHDSEPVVTDNGNWILDCTFPDGIGHPAGTETDLNAIPGVVENGLFVGMADLLIVGKADGSCDESAAPDSD